MCPARSLISHPRSKLQFALSIVSRTPHGLSPLANSNVTLASAVRSWWRTQRETAGRIRAAGRFLEIVGRFLRESLPERRRQRYGDMEYDWEHRVDTTSATVTWPTRFMGLLSSPYQPVPPEDFRAIMSSLALDFRRFTFVDIGSGKGRAVLLAHEYGFGRVIGVELLPELDRIARNNLRKLGVPEENSGIELLCRDAAEFEFPNQQLLVFLFNPLPAPGLQRVVDNLARSLQKNPRAVYVVYANPEQEEILAKCQALRKLTGTRQYSIFSSCAIWEDS